MLAKNITFFLIALSWYGCLAEIVVNKDLFRPMYHVYPLTGWMNDPNGFSIFKDEYHLFYQYNPESSMEPGIAHWAHVKSPDLIHWENLPIAMFPDQPYDKDGVFSGSAIIVNDTMCLFYTGNVNNPDENPDHTQWQALATSTDGVNVTKYAGNPIIIGKERQPDIRDPKVWKHGDTFYMVLGNSYNNNTLGRVLLYSSKDMISWKEESVLGQSDGELGYMWECPDFFELDGKFVLLFSPQGVKPKGDKYKNLYQCGYMIGSFDYETHVFKAECEFKELDHGHDFYATQTILDKSGKRVVIAWFDMWEQDYPEREDGWTGQMTFPRILTIEDGCNLIQKPVEQLSTARGKKLRSGRGYGGDCIQLKNKAGEIRIRAPKKQNFKLFIESSNVTVSITYNYLKGTVTLDRGGQDGVRRTNWKPNGQLRWRILIDTSSIELFCEDGKVTFSSRYFPYGDVNIRLGNRVTATDFTVYEMQRTVPAIELTT